MPSFSGLRASFFGSFLAASSSSIAWDLRHYAVFPQVCRFQRGAAQRQIEVVVVEFVVAAVDQRPVSRLARLVGRAGLRGPAGGRVEHVGRLSRCLSGPGSPCRSCARSGRPGRSPALPPLSTIVLRDPGGRDDQPRGAFQVEGCLVEGVTVAERHLPEGRARFAVGAVAVAERARRRADLSQDLRRVADVAGAPARPRPLRYRRLYGMLGALGVDQVSCTDSAPVRVSRTTSCSNAPRFTVLIIW